MVLRACACLSLFLQGPGSLRKKGREGGEDEEGERERERGVSPKSDGRLFVEGLVDKMPLTLSHRSHPGSLLLLLLLLLK